MAPPRSNLPSQRVILLDMPGAAETRRGCLSKDPQKGDDQGAHCRSGGGAPERSTLAGLRKDKELLAGADAKPEYASVAATIAAIDPAQTLYYQACPENNRKARSPANTCTAKWF